MQNYTSPNIHIYIIYLEKKYANIIGNIRGVDKVLEGYLEVGPLASWTDH
jgi:hypothetical protein